MIKDTKKLKEKKKGCMESFKRRMREINVIILKNRDKLEKNH